MLGPVTKTSKHRDGRHGTAQMMVFTGPELANAMDRTIQAPVERLFHQFDISVREITGVSDLFIEQPLCDVIVHQRGLQPPGSEAMPLLLSAHQSQ